MIMRTTWIESGKNKVTIEEFKKFLENKLPNEKKERMKFLFNLCHLSMSMAENNIITENKILLSSIADSVYSSLFLSGLDYPLIDEKTETLSLNKGFVENFAKLYREIIPENYYNENGKINQDVLLLHFISSVTNNSLFQGDALHEITNNMIICGLEGYKGYKDLSANLEVINDIFNKKIGVSSENYFKALFVLWAYSCKHSIINTNKFIPKKSKKNEHIIEKVIDDLSFKIKDEHDKFNFSDSYSGDARAMATFCRLPLIKISSVHYLITSKSFMMVQMTRKFLDKSLQFARDIEDITSSQFSSKLGKRFENYFFRLSENWLNLNEFKREHECFLGKKNAPVPDFICLERYESSNVTIFLQLKIKMPIEKTMYGYSHESMEKDLEKFSELIYKSIKYLYKLKKYLKGNSLTIEDRRFFEKTLSSKNLCLFGVIPSSPSFFHLKFMRKIIWEHAIRKLCPEENDWFHENYINGENKGRISWYIFPLIEFQSFLAIPEGEQRLFEIFKEYIDCYEIDDCEIKGNDIMSDFRSFIYEKYSKDKVKMNPELKRIFEKYHEESKSFFS